MTINQSTRSKLIVGQGHRSTAIEASSDPPIAAPPRGRMLALVIALSVMAGVGFGATGYYLAKQALTHPPHSSESDPPAGAPALRQQLLLQLMLVTGVAGLVVGAIALWFSQNRHQAARRSSLAPEAQLFSDIAAHTQPLDTLYIYQRAVEGARAILQADRTLLYSLDANWNGTIMAESIAPGWRPLINQNAANICFQAHQAELYQAGHISIIDDVARAGRSDADLKALTAAQVKASLIVPLLKDNGVFGLLIAHQCNQPRQWTTAEVNFLIRLTTLMSLGVGHAHFLSERTKADQLNSRLSEPQPSPPQPSAKTYESQLAKLIQEVQGMAQGDLTVKAQTTTPEIDHMANFLNTTLENLRQIIAHVKQSARQINTSLSDHEGVANQLATTALKQTGETNQMQAAIEQMTTAMQVIADKTHQAAGVASMTATTAQANDIDIDRTAKSILTLRDTIATATKKVKRLDDSSQEIAKVAASISQIASQTKLLAINASIEASRHQDFTPVADKVNDLAAQATKATVEIEQIVDDIQQYTRDVVQAMGQSTNQIVEGTHLIETTQQNLEQMSAVSQQIDQLVTSLSTATGAQVETTQVLSDLAQALVQTSQSTSDSSRWVTDSLRQTVEIAQALQTSVGTFKISSQV
ncbi:MAG: GAF domain-containing protein [Cyanothece sp. SIO1E1]|nr:GAF domain-containing protein [Cyanothece sp. SIO1E1]